MTSYINKLKLLGKEIYIFDKYNKGKSMNCKVSVDSCYLLNNKIVIVLKNGVTKKYEAIQLDVKQSLRGIVYYMGTISIEYNSFRGVQCIKLYLTTSKIMDNITTIFSFNNGRILHFSNYRNFSFAVYNTKEIGKILYIIGKENMQKIQVFVNENLSIFDITYNKDDKAIVLDDENSSIYNIRQTKNKYDTIGFTDIVGDV